MADIPVLFLLLVLATPAAAAEVTLELRTKGAVTADLTVTHPVDAAHFCSAAVDPWAPEQQVDIRPAPYPFYRFIYGQPGPAAAPESPGPSLDIALSHWTPPGGTEWIGDHEDPQHDSFEIVLEGRHFIGRPGLPDPAPRLQFAWRDDGRGGGFLVTGLHEIGGDGRLDAEGTWACPAIDNVLPEVRVAKYPLFSGALRASAAPPRLGYALRRQGEAWHAIGADGVAFAAHADLRALRLAPMLRSWAEQGRVVLMVDGQVSGGNPPRLIARRLDGVVPAPP